MNRVLIIEDDVLTRENLALILRMESFAVTTAPDGAAGLELARRERPDLILCDISMPRMNGHQVLTALRAQPATAAVPFIFLTALGERLDQRAGMNLGADDYLCKPVEAEDLLAAIQARLRRHSENAQVALREGGLPDFSAATPLETLGLTAREAEVLLWVAQGKGNSDVATILGLSEKTVKIHLGHIFEKLNVETRTAAARLAIEALPRLPGTPPTPEPAPR